jgi:acetyltransferase-like isoleucine patch superfamily enzyme
MEKSVSVPTLKTIDIKGVEFGEGVIVVQPANLYGCRIGDGTFIGPFVEVQAGAAIGRRCRVQSHAFVCDLVSIGDDCFIGHGVMFINDVFRSGGPAGGDRGLWKATRIGDRVSIGSNATILPVEICSDVVIGAGSVVTRSITRAGIYAGNPARFLRDVQEQRKS